MKKIIFLLILTLVSLHSFSQKFGYVDTEFITSKMPDYKKAQEDMEKYSEKWVVDIQGKYTELDKMRQQYQQEEILLTADMRRERQKALEDKEREVKELNNKVFGMNGMLFLKKKEIMKQLMEQLGEKSKD